MKTTIKERIYEIYDIWDNVSLKKAKAELKILYFQYYHDLKDIEEKRLILHNLTVAEMQDNNMDSAYIYSEELLNDMNKIKGYKEKEPCNYCKVLNNYIETHKEYLSKENLIKNYELCVNIYEKYCDDTEYGCLAKLIMQFNLNLIKENFNTVLEIFENVLIHNKDLQHNDTLNHFIEDTKKINTDICNKMKNMKDNYEYYKIG